MFTSESHKEMVETLRSMGYDGPTPMVDYLNDLADEHGVDVSVVRSLVQVVGIEEMFDGLVSAVQDYAADGCFDSDY